MNIRDALTQYNGAGRVWNPGGCLGRVAMATIPLIVVVVLIF